jgi:hypothetical protein
MKNNYPLTTRKRQDTNKLDFEEWWPDSSQKRKYERTPVTVCIAAICKNTMSPEGGFIVIGATDRMLTGGDIEYEPKSTNKILHFSTAITGMFAGNLNFQTEVVRRVSFVVQARINSEPQKWWEVKEVAELYAKSYQESHLKRAENAILAPLGYDLNSFHADQQRMNPELLKQLSTKLTQFTSPEVQAIFCGLDLTGLGPHIYVVDNSANVVCHDITGFAAIGAGYWHADSQFMFASHTYEKSFAETLLLVYSAKKQAEVAPGVGKDTDMFLIGPTLGKHIVIDEHVLKELQATHDTIQIKKQQVEAEAEPLVKKLIEKLQAEAAKQQKTDSPVPNTSLPATKPEEPHEKKP